MQKCSFIEILYIVIRAILPYYRGKIALAPAKIAGYSYYIILIGAIFAAKTAKIAPKSANFDCKSSQNVLIFLQKPPQKGGFFKVFYSKSNKIGAILTQKGSKLPQNRPILGQKAPK
jgi:hypothetical protein